jgi:hypothetical protein
MNWVDGAGYLASALVLATLCMKTMIPLRAAAIFSNVVFLVYGCQEERLMANANRAAAAAAN